MKTYLYQRLYGLILVSSFIFLSDTLSLKGKKLDFYGRGDTYVSLSNIIPELSRFTACVDLISMADSSTYWMAFSYITNNTFLGREDIDLGLAGDHKQIILYSLGKIFYISYSLIPLQWHTICLMWDGVEGRLELLLNRQRILAITDQPHSLPPNGTLVLGHFPKNGEMQGIKVPYFIGSLYYFQLWDRILENEEFWKCAHGNVVSWDEDVWLLHKITPTVDRRLRCLVYENMTIQETSTTVSQQIDFTTPPQITGLNPQKTVHVSTVMSKSRPVFATDHAIITYSSSAASPLATVTALKTLKTTIAKTDKFADIFSTSTASPLPTQNTFLHTTTDSMKRTQHPYSEKAETTEMVEPIVTETFHPSTSANFFSTSGVTKNFMDLTVSKTLATKSQSAVTKTTSLLLTKESASMSATLLPKHKSTDAAVLPTTRSVPGFVLSSAARTESWFTGEETSTIPTGTGTDPTFSPESLVISTAIPANSLLPGNQVVSTLATTDMKIALPVHSVLPTETTPIGRTVKAESLSTHFQDTSSRSMEDAISTSTLKESSSVVLSFMTSSPITGSQSRQLVTDSENTHPTLTPGITLGPALSKPSLFPTMENPVYTQNTLLSGKPTVTLNPTNSLSTFMASESGPTPATDENAYQVSTNETSWTSRPSQTLLTSKNMTTILTFMPSENFTSILHGSTTDPDYSSLTTTTNTIPLEASTERKATTSSGATIARYTTPPSKLTSLWFDNFSSGSASTAVSNGNELKGTTLPQESITVSTVAVNKLPSLPRETVFPSVDKSTLADIKQNFSTENTSETTQTHDISTFGGTVVPTPKSSTTKGFYTTVTRIETTPQHSKGKSTIVKVSPFSAMPEAMDESAKTVTSAVTVSPLDNETATIGTGVDWLSTKLIKTTPKSSYDGTAGSSYNGTTGIFNSSHIYAVYQTLGFEGNATPLLTSVSTQTISELVSASTTRVLGTSPSTTATHRTVMTLSADILPPQTLATQSSATPQPVTHMFSLPDNVPAATSPVTSSVISDATKVTLSMPSTPARGFSTSTLSGLPATKSTALVPPIGPTMSVTIDAMPTHRDIFHTTTEVTIIPTTAAFLGVSSPTPPTPVTTKAKSTFPSTSADISLSACTPVCSKPSPSNVSIYGNSTIFTSVTNPSISPTKKTSTLAVSVPYAFSSEGDVRVSTSLPETSVVDETRPPSISSIRLTTSADTSISQSSTRLSNTPISTSLVTDTSTSSFDKEQVSISLGGTSRMTGVAELSPSENSLIPYSQSTAALKMTGAEASETTEISSHQTHFPSMIPPETQSTENVAVSPTSGGTQTAHALTSSNIKGVYISKMATSLENLAHPSQVQTISQFLSPEKESTSTLSGYTPGVAEIITNSSSMTHPVSYHQDTSLVDTTSTTTSIPSPVLTSTTVSHLPSHKTPLQETSVASSMSEPAQTFPKSLSPLTTGHLHANFTMFSPGGITATFSVPNIPTAFPEAVPVETSVPVYQVSSLPANVTVFTSEHVSDAPTILKTTTILPGCLKNISIATSGSMSEKSSMAVNSAASTTAAVSSGISREVGAVSTLLSPVTPRTDKTAQTSTLDTTPVAYVGTTSKRLMVPSTFTNPDMVDISSKNMTTHALSPTEPTFRSIKTIPITILAAIMTSVVGNTESSLSSSKNITATSSIPETMFSSLLSTDQPSSQENEATTLGIFPEITDNSLSTERNSRVTAVISTYSSTALPDSVFSPTPSDSLHTSVNIQVSPSLSSSKSIPGSTPNIKATMTRLSSNIGKMTSLTENALLSELTKSDTSMTTPDLYPLWTQTSTTPPSSTSFLYSPHSTETKFSTPNISPPFTSPTVEFPVMRTGITPISTQSLITASWNTPGFEDARFPISTTTYKKTPNTMEAETQHFIPGSLSTFRASQNSLVSSEITTLPSVSTSEILPVFGLSESTALSSVLPTTLASLKHTSEKRATSGTTGITLPLSPSITSGGTSPVVISSNLPSGFPLTTISSTPHILTSSPREVSESTSRASDITSIYPFANFTTLPFASESKILTKITPVPPMGTITAGSLTSLPIAEKNTDDRAHNSVVPEVSPRITVPENFRTVSELSSFSRMSISPSTTGLTLSIGPTKTSAWSRDPATSVSLTLLLSKSTLDSLINVTTSTSTATGASFPLTSTGIVRPSIGTVFSPISSFFETSWMDSTSSFLLTLPVTTKATVSFYNIEMGFSVFDEEPRVLITDIINDFAKIWLNSIFQDSEFSVANLAIQMKSRDTSKEEIIMYRHILEQREGQGMATISHVPYSCSCQIIIKATSSLASEEIISRIQSKIHGNFTQGQLTLLVNSDPVAVRKLEPGECNADETHSKYKGTYKWLLTDPTETAQARCIKNDNGNATRICSISIQTGKSQWEKPTFKQCKLLQDLPDKIVDLVNITISDENADDVAEHILNLVNESPPLDKEETRIIVSKVADISKCDEISMNLTQIILQIISAVTEKQKDSASNLPQVSNEILRIIERAGHKMEFVGQTANLTVDRLALAVLRVDHRFEGMAFSIRSREEVIDPEIFLGDVPLGRVLASIYLPKSLKEKIPLKSLQTILFNFFGQTSLFKAQNITRELTTFVVSASISNVVIQNLVDPVVITLKHIERNQNYNELYCAFWDFDANDGLGGWNSSGCKVKETNVNYTICQCNHLTHFGVLMDLSRSTVDPVNERILVIITYIGCGMSSIFLGIAMVTYLAFHKLRKDYPSKILINLCMALLMLNLAFLVNSWLSSFQKVGLCITAAVALHYFLLVSLTWMGLEAVHMYFALVKVFNIYIPNYILKFCLVGWGIPAITVAIILSVKKDPYGTLSLTTPFCWIQNDCIFYISVVAYFCLIFLMNISMFCTVLAQLNSVKSQSQKTRRKMILHDLKGTISLTFLLGLTWGFAFFAWGPVRIFFMYLFAICNTLQGFFIFVFYCVMKDSVREQWQIHLRWRWLQLYSTSDGSSKFGLNLKHKKERMKKTRELKLLTPSFKSSGTNSTFKSIGSAPGAPAEIKLPKW